MTIEAEPRCLEVRRTLFRLIEFFPTPLSLCDFSPSRSEGVRQKTPAIRVRINRYTKNLKTQYNKGVQTTRVTGGFDFGDSPQNPYLKNFWGVKLIFYLNTI